MSGWFFSRITPYARPESSSDPKALTDDSKSLADLIERNVLVKPGFSG